MHLYVDRSVLGPVVGALISARRQIEQNDVDNFTEFQGDHVSPDLRRRQQRRRRRRALLLFLVLVSSSIREDPLPARVLAVAQERRRLLRVQLVSFHFLHPKRDAGVGERRRVGGVFRDRLERRRDAFGSSQRRPRHCLPEALLPQKAHILGTRRGIRLNHLVKGPAHLPSCQKGLRHV